MPGPESSTARRSRSGCGRVEADLDGARRAGVWRSALPSRLAITWPMRRRSTGRDGRPAARIPRRWRRPSPRPGSRTVPPRPRAISARSASSSPSARVPDSSSESSFRSSTSRESRSVSSCSPSSVERSLRVHPVEHRLHRALDQADGRAQLVGGVRDHAPPPSSWSRRALVIRLNVSASRAISSRPCTATRTSRSPAPARSAARVSSATGFVSRRTASSPIARAAARRCPGRARWPG